MSDSPTIKAGDTVSLKTQNQPTMVVGVVSKEAVATCYYFAGANSGFGDLKTVQIHIEALKKL